MRPDQQFVVERFQSTPSGGKATLQHTTHPPGCQVSIHAFRGEGDRRCAVRDRSAVSFNPRLPGGRRLALKRCHNTVYKCFNPRLPGGRRLRLLRYSRSLYRSFNPRLPGGRRRGSNPGRTGSLPFQSTPSGGKATCAAHRIRLIRRCFNPRLPGGRRPVTPIAARISSAFQSTPSGGKATLRRVRVDKCECVSIHAFRGEGDPQPPPARRPRRRFNPRLPGGRRRGEPNDQRAGRGFQSTPSGGKATW